MPRARLAAPNRVHFWCPGCDAVHGIRYGNPATDWTWNGDLEHPTFTPSVLVHEHPTLNEHGQQVMTPRCHSYVTDGRIQFLADCTHPLAGQTVDLPNWPYGG